MDSDKAWRGEIKAKGSRNENASGMLKRNLPNSYEGQITSTVTELAEDALMEEKIRMW